MLKKILLTLLVLLLAGAAVGGTWYYMDMQVKAAQDETIAVNGQLTTTKAELLTAQNELKAKADAEAILAANLATLDQWIANVTQTASGQTTGTGTETSTGQISALLNTLYDSGVTVEGMVNADNLRIYSFELQKLAQSTTPSAPVVAQPIKLAQGEWTAVVQVKETPLEKKSSVTSIVSSTGALLKEKLSPLLPKRELVVVLAKWANGKIVEQYEFPYAGEANESKILEYLKK